LIFDNIPFPKIVFYPCLPNSPYFLERVFLDTVVMSVDKNNYSHPAEEVLDLISDYGIKLFRTDEVGDIKIIFDSEIY